MERQKKDPEDFTIDMVLRYVLRDKKLREKYIKISENEIPKIKKLHSPVDYYGKTFIVQTVCKEDLREYFTPGQLEKLTDEDMSRIAEKIGDAIMECSYWDIVETACNYLKEK